MKSFRVYGTDILLCLCTISFKSEVIVVAFVNVVGEKFGDACTQLRQETNIEKIQLHQDTEVFFILPNTIITVLILINMSA